jgi:two-component system KDP operon response regulator KdpE
MNPSRVLVADYDPHSRAVLRRALEAAGHQVVEADARQLALELARSAQYHMILLDTSMDAMVLPETCRAMRAGSPLGIIVLSNISSEKDAIDALTAGADDYLVKPFHVPELLARIRAVLRRLPLSTHNGPHRVRLGDRVIDFKAHLVRTENNGVIHLTPKECQLLQQLIIHPNEALTHRDLLQAVWGSDRKEDVGYLRVFVKQLRRKIEPNPRSPEYILTEPWIGYRFQPGKTAGKVTAAIL